MSTAIEIYRQLGRLLPTAGSRQIEDGPTTEELSLENGFAGELEPSLEQLYTLPLLNGLEFVIDQSREAVARWVLDYYTDNPDLLTPLSLILSNYVERGFNLGGSMGLSMMGMDGHFELSDPAILDDLGEHVQDLATPQGSLSLVRTTASELAIQADNAPDGIEYSDFLALASSYAAARAVVRSGTIAETETVRLTRRGMLSAFVANGAGEVEFHTQGDDRVCPLCEPLEGNEYRITNPFNPLANIPSAAWIPVHTGCRCYYRVQLSDWEPPETVWTGFDLTELGV